MIAIFLGLIFDYLFGEPKRFHPLVAFGSMASRIESVVLQYANGRYVRWAGGIAWMLAVLPCVWLTHTLVAVLPIPNWLFEAVIVYLAIGRRSLVEHALAVFEPLQQGDVAQARHRVSYLVSRDVTKLDETGLAKATVESVLENGSDSTFGVLFWCVVGGAPAVVLYRLANTLDAMWGYKNTRYREFGFMTAKIDDLLNYIPARLTALSYAAMGHTDQALACVKSQAPLCESPNAGPVMAAGAGALGVRLGGEYHHSGQVIVKPVLGIGQEANHVTIVKAVGLMNRAVVLWCVLLLMAYWV